MSSSSTSSSNRRFVPWLALALAGLLLVDYFLVDRAGFAAAFGTATSEGQVMRKMRIADRFAEVSDVIMFGSSMTRSGAASEPFLRRGLLPQNLAVSGGGPLYDYYALKRIAPIIARRDDKPVLVLELNDWPLVEQWTRDSDRYTWSELEVFRGVSRGRVETFMDFPRLFDNFLDYGMASRFVASTVLPSGIYRQYVRPIVSQRGDLGDYFYGIEDCCGYAPLYNVVSVPNPTKPILAPPYDMSKFMPAKLDYIRSFLQLAAELGCRVIVASRPSGNFEGDDHLYDKLMESLATSHSDLTVLRPSDYGLQMAHFSDGHLNIWGSDIFSNAIIDKGSLQGDPDSLAAKMDHVFHRLELADPRDWNTPATTSAQTTAKPVWQASTFVTVPSDGEVILEIEVGAGVETATILMDSVGNAGTAVGRPSGVGVPPADRPRRAFVRLRPVSHQVVIVAQGIGSLPDDLHVIRLVQERS